MTPPDARRVIAKVTHAIDGHPRVHAILPPDAGGWSIESEECPPTAGRDFFGCTTCADNVRGTILKSLQAWGQCHQAPFFVDVDGTVVPHHTAARYGPIGRLARHHGPPPERVVVSIGTVDGHLAVARFIMADTTDAAAAPSRFGQFPPHPPRRPPPGQDAAWTITPARHRPMCDGRRLPAPDDICTDCMDAALTLLSGRRFTVECGGRAADADRTEDVELIVLLSTCTPI